MFNKNTGTVSGITLLHKRYTDWSGKTLAQGELGIKYDASGNYQLRVGTKANCSWNDAAPVSCKVVIQGSGNLIKSATYNSQTQVLTIALTTLAADTGLKLNTTDTATSIGFDPDITFIFDCGNSEDEIVEPGDIQYVDNTSGGTTAIIE